jgi:hypothetical protein
MFVARAREYVFARSPAHRHYPHIVSTFFTNKQHALRVVRIMLMTEHLTMNHEDQYGLELELDLRVDTGRMSMECCV